MSCINCASYVSPAQSIQWSFFSPLKKQKSNDEDDGNNDYDDNDFDYNDLHV